MKSIFLVKSKAAIAIVVMAFFTSACASPVEKKEPLTCENAHTQMVGMDKEKALEYIKESGFYPRILREDGKSFVGTHDYRTDRMNLFIENGKLLGLRCG